MLLPSASQKTHDIIWTYSPHNTTNIFISIDASILFIIFFTISKVASHQSIWQGDCENKSCIKNGRINSNPTTKIAFSKLYLVTNTTFYNYGY